MTDIFDFHTHLGAHDLIDHWNAGALVQLLDRYSISQAVVMPWDDAPAQNPHANDEIGEATRRFPDRLIGFARIHPKDGSNARDEFRRAIEDLGLRGLKLHPLTTGSRLDDPLSLTLVELATEYGVPVYYHSGDDPTTQPTMFEMVVRAVPDATIILGHGGAFFFWRDAAELAARYENVYLSTPGSMGPEHLRQCIEIAGAAKLLFGSDTPAMHVAVELAKIDAVDLSNEQRRLILAENARRMLSRSHTEEDGGQR